MRLRALLTPPKVLFVACSDDRLPILGFLEEELRLPEGFYFPLRLAGGLSPLAHEKELPDDFQSVLKQTRIIEHKPTITSAIILEHADCTYRKTHIPQFAHNGIEDLLVIADVLSQNLPQLTQIQLWYANLIVHDFDFQKIKVITPQTVSAV